MTPADCIKNLRSILGLNQSEFAKKIKIGKSMASLYESGKCEPGFFTAKKIIELAKKNGINIEFMDLKTK